MVTLRPAIPPFFFFTQLEDSIFAKSGGKYTRRIGWEVLHILQSGKPLLCSSWDKPSGACPALGLSDSAPRAERQSHASNETAKV